MGKKQKKEDKCDKYDSHVKPFLEKIKQWATNANEGEIARRLGICQRTLIKYKKEHSELAEVLREGRQDLACELKTLLIRKAKGYVYVEETVGEKTDENGKKTKYKEKRTKYAHPDTGAIHLLLKNIDKTWHNDDYDTLQLKKETVEIQREKAANSVWT